MTTLDDSFDNGQSRHAMFIGQAMSNAPQVRAIIHLNTRALSAASRIASCRLVSTILVTRMTRSPSMTSTHDPANALPADDAPPRGSTSPPTIANWFGALQPATAAAVDTDHLPWFGVLVAVLTCNCSATDARQLELPWDDQPSPCATATVRDVAFVLAERGVAECTGYGRSSLLVCWRIMAPAAALLNAMDVARPVPQPVIPPGLQPGGRTRGIAAAAALARGSGRDIGLAISSA